MKSDLLIPKTLLSIYDQIEYVVKTLDDRILKQGLSAMRDFYQSNTLSTLQEIINLSERKVTLINLKIFIEELLAEINKQHSQILKAKFLDKKTILEISSYFNINQRSVYRNIETALKSFNYLMHLKGFNEKKFKTLQNNECWINCAYKKIVEEKSVVDVVAFVKGRRKHDRV